MPCSPCSARCYVVDTPRHWGFASVRYRVAFITETCVTVGHRKKKKRSNGHHVGAVACAFVVGERGTWHRRRIADYLADDQTDASDNESFITACSSDEFSSAAVGGVGVGMLPEFPRGPERPGGGDAGAGRGVHGGAQRDADHRGTLRAHHRADDGRRAEPEPVLVDDVAYTAQVRVDAVPLAVDVAAAAPPPPPPPDPPPQPVREEEAVAARERRKAQARRLDRSRSGARRALKGLRFISGSTAHDETPAELWGRVEERFHALARDGLLARDDFGECVGNGMEKSKEFAAGVFDALARRRRQSLERITKDELHDFWLQISDQSFDARLQIFFDMSLLSSSVLAISFWPINRDRLLPLIVLSASANKLSKLKEQAEEYAALIMEELDPENFGYIELWQLEALLLQRDAYMTYSRPLSSDGGSTQLSQGLGGAVSFSSRTQQHQQGRGGGGPTTSQRCGWSVRRAASRARVAASEGWRRAWVVALWVAAMAALFAWKFAEYRRSPAFGVMGYCLPTAKGAAETLKLNMALVLLPVCRNTLTWLRSSWARFVVPFDDSIAFHKIIAMAIALGICLHAGNHLACDFPRLIASGPDEYRLVAGYFGSTKPTYRSLLAGAEGVTGIVMVTLMAVSFTFAARPFRKREEQRACRRPSSSSSSSQQAAAHHHRNRCFSPLLDRLAGFNAFWYSHHLLIVVYLLLLAHGWFLFLVHRWYQRTVCLLPGNVLTITMSKPYGFRYRSGQYIFLQCPIISPFEWHPFSITSAPGDDYISVHIQTRGDWTQELKRIFVENYLMPCVPRRTAFGELGMAEQKSPPRLLVDGPYGAPAQDFRNYDVLLLIGLGIGATPFISILRDLLNNIKLADELMDLALETSRSEDSTNSFSVSTTSSNKRRVYRTSHAHFYWVTREPESFEWFKGVMNEVEQMDKKGVIEMHNYLTGVYEERDARTTLLSMVQALNHAKHGVDIVSGTRVRTHFARPNWKEVFTRIASQHPNSTVGVFYCGRANLAKELKKLSIDMSHKTGTRFHFHKEYF
ncbi:hypothetical protein PR202_gb03008 [Eleusine coracana subsp. coracana]|uniref:FAD-binding FR-type domain-containing protein n=1 Tax=Eleusine coracana subsp. coracana TaxID=191504 RepID=A0AAV5E0Q8_ELECO|nr:hypothetical protein PR202_gb03008 [Eleusine coracana subsp. coracana]